jgi:hypothetical protein
MEIAVGNFFVKDLKIMTLADVQHFSLFDINDEVHAMFGVVADKGISAVTSIRTDIAVAETRMAD